MENIQSSTNSELANKIHMNGFWLTEIIQKKTPFTLDLDLMEILPATAEIKYSGYIIGQIQNGPVGIRFQTYPEEVRLCMLHLLMQANLI